jgi:hypothetical protein
VSRCCRPHCLVEGVARFGALRSKKILRGLESLALFLRVGKSEDVRSYFGYGPGKELERGRFCYARNSIFEERHYWFSFVIIVASM